MQGLLAKYPDLLAGDQINTTKPRRLLLVSREVSLTSKENGAHLLRGRPATQHR